VQREGAGVRVEMMACIRQHAHAVCDKRRRRRRRAFKSYVTALRGHRILALHIRYIFVTYPLHIRYISDHRILALHYHTASEFH